MTERAGAGEGVPAGFVSVTDQRGQARTLRVQDWQRELRAQLGIGAVYDELGEMIERRGLLAVVGAILGHASARQCQASQAGKENAEAWWRDITLELAEVVAHVGAAEHAEAEE
jgi:hypothetical protein